MSKVRVKIQAYGIFDCVDCHFKVYQGIPVNNLFLVFIY